MKRYTWLLLALTAGMLFTAGCHTHHEHDRYDRSYQREDGHHHHDTYRRY
jgi:hypothetical protein